MAISFKPEDFTEMQALQRQLEIVLQRANEDRLEGVLAVFALVRCARKILERYPAATQKALIDEVLTPFLAGEPYEP